jgi:serine/threonine protein kinase
MNLLLEFSKTIKYIHDEDYVLTDLKDQNVMVKMSGRDISAFILIDLGAIKYRKETINALTPTFAPLEANLKFFVPGF